MSYFALYRKKPFFLNFCFPFVFHFDLKKELEIYRCSEKFIKEIAKE